jgi:hypothetical protein
LSSLAQAPEAAISQRGSLAQATTATLGWLGSTGDNPVNIRVRHLSDRAEKIAPDSQDFRFAASMNSCNDPPRASDGKDYRNPLSTFNIVSDNFVQGRPVKRRVEGKRAYDGF